MKVEMEKSKQRLAVLWFVGAGAIFGLVFVQTVLGKYRDAIDETWAWLMPTILPTLSLMVSIFVVDALRKKASTRKADRFLFRLTFALSTGYLMLVALTILLEPFSDMEGSEMLRISNLWLGPFQGLTSASLGAFFFKSED